MKLLQFMWKFRRGRLLLSLAAYPVCAVLGLTHMGSPWMLLSCIFLPALMIEGAVKCWVNRFRCVEQMGRQVAHNVDEDGKPTNAGWDKAVLRICKDGHLYAYVHAKVDRGEINLDFK